MSISCSNQVSQDKSNVSTNHSHSNPLLSSRGASFQRSITPKVYKGVTPARIYIPAIGLHAEVVPVTISAQGRMEVPSDTERVGFLMSGALPGERGSAVMDGHFDSHSGPSVFFNLKKLKVGDRLYIKNIKGAAVEFKVEEIGIYRTAEAPIKRIFGPSDEPRLNLITCTGKFSRKKREHEERLVIYTKRS